MKPVSALTIAVAALVTAGCGPALPNDAELMATFEDNRRAFEHVRQLVLPADGVERIERNKLGQLTQLSDAQRKGLADFMDATGVRLITAGSSPKGLQAVEFTIHRSGFVFGGAMKGIGWRNAKFEHIPVLNSLDDPTDRRGFVTNTWFHANRPLGEGWFLYLSRD